MTAHQLLERRACRALGVPRSTLRCPTVEPERDKESSLRIGGLAREHPRYGYRRVAAPLRRAAGLVEREQLHPAPGRAAQTRVELRLRDGPGQRRQAAEDPPRGR